MKRFMASQVLLVMVLSLVFPAMAQSNLNLNTPTQDNTPTREVLVSGGQGGGGIVTARSDSTSSPAAAETAMNLSDWLDVLDTLFFGVMVVAICYVLVTQSKMLGISIPVEALSPVMASGLQAVERGRADVSNYVKGSKNPYDDVIWGVLNGSMDSIVDKVKAELNKPVPPKMDGGKPQLE